MKNLHQKRFPSPTNLRGFITLIILIAAAGTLAPLAAQETDTLYILQTTDVHGNILPYNYFKDEPADYGLAKIFTRVSDYRLNHDNVLLLDGGDLIQGTPLSYYFNKVDTEVPNPLILTLNYMGYDAFAVGNHDIEQGLFVYHRARRESNFPWLSANSRLEDGRSYFDPYSIIEVNDIVVGVIGLTTPGIPMWLDPLLYPGITWTDMTETARYYAKQLRPHVDVLVGLFHAGFNAGYSAEQTAALGLPNENASGMIADSLPEFDVIFAGHSHNEQPGPGTVEMVSSGGPALRINAGSRARNLGVAQLILKRKVRQNNTPANWQITEKKSWLEPMQNVPSSPAIEQLNAYYHQATLQYIRTEIATLSDTLSSRRSRFEDTPYVELINRAQMDYTSTQISFAAAFNDRFVLPPGPIHIKDIYNMYWYENYLYVIEMTGQQIKDFLEYSAGYYMVEGGRLQANPEMQGYNYDMAEGIGYEIHADRKPGARIAELYLMESGDPLDMKANYQVAMNSYRATGGGGHLAAAGIKQPKILWKSNEEIRNILAEYILDHEVIDPVADGNWRVVY